MAGSSPEVQEQQHFQHVIPAKVTIGDTITVGVVGGRPWQEVLDGSGRQGELELNEIAKATFQRIIEVWPNEDCIDTLFKGLTVEERDRLFRMGPELDQLPDGLGHDLDILMDDLDKEEGWLATGASRINSNGEVEMSMGDMAGESAAGGGSVLMDKRKYKMNVISKALQEVNPELAVRLVLKKPKNSSDRRGWTAYFKEFSEMVKAAEIDNAVINKHIEEYDAIVERCDDEVSISWVTHSVTMGDQPYL